MTLRPEKTDSPLSFDLILPNIIATTRKQAIAKISKEAMKLTGVKDKILMERMMDSGNDSAAMISEGAELSHLRVSGLEKPVTIFATFKNPVPFGSADKKDVDVFFLIITPERNSSTYLRTLARASRLLRNKQMRKDLVLAKDEAALRAVLDETSLGLLAA